MLTIALVRARHRVPWRSLFAVLLVGAAPVPSGFEATRSTDARLAAIAYRLQTGNAALCRTLAPVPGWALLSPGQYAPASRGAVGAAFGFATAVGVEAVVAGAPAAHAGVRQGDSLVAINGLPIDTELPAQASVANRDAALDLLARQPSAAPVVLTLRGARVDHTVTIPASPGCAAIVEVRYGGGLDARADGRRVQIGSRFFDRYDDGLVAAVVAHELAHVVLGHHDRLDAAGVSRSLMASLGRSGRLIRSTEDEADALSAALLYNAGYDPALAVQLWREHGGDLDAGLLRSRDHASPAARAKAIAAAIAAIPAGAPRPYVPHAIASRDAPL